MATLTSRTFLICLKRSAEDMSELLYELPR